MQRLSADDIGGHMVVMDGGMSWSPPPFLLMFEHAHAATAKGGMCRVLADISFVVPTTLAFATPGPGYLDRRQGVVLTCQ